MNRSIPTSLILLVTILSLRGQDENATTEGTSTTPSVTVEESATATTESSETDVTETPPSGDAASFEVPEQMALFAGHVGSWKGMTKTKVVEKEAESLSNTRSEWTGGYLLGGHAFEIRGYSYGELGRTHYRWQYTYDALKERFMAAYHDSHGRTHFCEGKVNEEGTKIIWRLIAPPGDMVWHAETDLQPENGIQTNGYIKSEEFDYDMVYSSVFRSA